MNINDMKSWQKIEFKAERKIKTDAARLSIAKSICSFNNIASVKIRKIAEKNVFDIYRDPITGRLHCVTGGESVDIRKSRMSSDGTAMFAIYAKNIINFFMAEGYKTYNVEVNEEDGDIILTPIGEKILKEAHS